MVGATGWLFFSQLHARMFQKPPSPFCFIAEKGRKKGRDKQTHTHKERQRVREINTHIHTMRDRKSERDKHTHTHKERQRE